MKKIIAIMLGLVMLMGVGAVALAEEEEFAPMPEAAAAFEGTWVCDRASIQMVWEEEGFRTFISWANSATENSEWEYTCDYNEKDNTVVSANGTRNEVVYNENGEVASWKEVYNDGEATFSLDADGRLIWKDAKEDAGKDMRFEFAGKIENNAEDPLLVKQALRWEDVENAEGIAPVLEMGQFTTLVKYDLDMWIPNTMKKVENTEHVYEFTSEDGTLHFYVRDEEIPAELADPQTLFNALKEKADGGAVTPSSINDMFCYTLSMNAGDDAIVVFVGDGHAVSFVFNNMTLQNSASFAKVMIASLQKSNS